MAFITESSCLESTESVSGPFILESFLSDDGQAFYLYKIALGGELCERTVLCEKWALICKAPQLVESTYCKLSTVGWKPIWLKYEGSDEPKIRLIPSKPTSGPPNLYDFMRSAKLRCRVPLGSLPAAGMQDAWSTPFAEYWGGVSHRDNFLILCRRKRPLSSSGGNPASQARNHNSAEPAHIMMNRRTDQTYDDTLDFDEMPEPEPSLQANDFDLESEAGAPDDDLSSSDSGNSTSSLPKSDNAAEEEDMRSLSGIGATETGSSDSWTESSDNLEIPSSFGSTDSSSSPGGSNISAERLRLREFFTTSENPWQHHEIIENHQEKICNLCATLIPRWLHCYECLNPDYDVCLGCIDKGRWCLDKSHELLETDGEGPIAMHRFSEWAVTNELRVYDVHSDGTQNCVLEFSAGGEDLLHESQPALHPSAPIFAWPISPTKLLLGSFEGDKERIIHPMKRFVKHGRKVDIQLHFSDSGSCLIVASIEAVKVRGQAQQYTYKLHMQVAVLQLCFEDQTLEDPVALCERHHDLRINVPSTVETLPFVWTWTANEVCLTLKRDKISLWRVKFTPSRHQQLHLGPVETSAAQLPLQQQNRPCRAQFVDVGEGSVPVVALIPLHAQKNSDAPSVCYIEADGPWSPCDEEDVTSEVNTQVPSATLVVGSQRYETHDGIRTKSADAPFSTSTTPLSKMRSEIRLLCLMPGWVDDALRATLITVSLDDLERSKSKLSELVSDFTRQKKEQQFNRSRGSTSKKEAVSEPKVLAQMDYSENPDTDLTIWDMYEEAMSKRDNDSDLKSISMTRLPGTMNAMVGAMMQERDQDRASIVKKWSHPTYSYEALSYVWGKSSGKCTITLDGKKDVPVTDNLYAALRRLRHPDRRRVLWVDAVCIDQMNVVERNWQVQMMGRIYSNAERVVVWLGDAEGPSPNFDEVPTADANELSQEGLNQEAGKEPDDSKSDTSEDSESESVPQWQKDILIHVLNTASPPWWTRAWVTQELVLAEDFSVAFGPVEVSWSTFESKMWSVWNSFGELKQLFDMRRRRRTWQYKGSIGETALVARHTRATEPKDKVYSLLSLVKLTQRSRVEPNYGLKTAEVFIQATYADLYDSVHGQDIYKESPDGFYQEMVGYEDVPSYPVMGDSDQIVQTGRRPDRFRILNWAKPGPEDRRLGMPSWAVNFADPDVFTGDAEFRHGSTRWTFDGNNNLNQRALLRISEDTRQLTVRGAVFGHIKDIVKEYPVREYRNKPAEEVVARLSTLLSSLPSESPYKLVSGPDVKLRTDDLRVVYRPNMVLTEDKPGEFHFEHKERVAVTLPHWDPLAEHETVDWTDLHSIALNRGDCKVEGCRCGPSQFFRSWDTCVGMRYYARNFPYYDPRMRRTSPWEDYCTLLKPESISNRPRDPLREEDCRFLLTTSSGFVGLGPEGAEVGDVIALFYGSDVPVVLRAEGDHYVYRGRAWINGIMQGELWNIYEDPLLEEQDFLIR